MHLYSFSKAYCVPGHRVGAIVAGAAIREQLAKVLDTMQICPPRAAQAALAWAVEALRDWRDGNRAIMAARARAFALAMAGVRMAVDALGGYFAYLRLPEGAPDAMAAAEHLAAERGLMGLPGPFFGPGGGGTCGWPSPMPRRTRSPRCRGGWRGCSPARPLPVVKGSRARDR